LTDERESHAQSRDIPAHSAKSPAARFELPHGVNTIVRVLAELFAANPLEIDDDLLENGPHGRHSTVEAKSLTLVSIASLGRILGVGTYDQMFDQAASDHREASSGESGVVLVPSALCDALVATAELEAAAASWAATEELRRDGWRPEDALPVLQELAELARNRTENQTVWLWWSL
jgi:hypothetical protein